MIIIGYLLNPVNDCQRPYVDVQDGILDSLFQLKRARSLRTNGKEHAHFLFIKKTYKGPRFCQSGPIVHIVQIHHKHLVASIALLF